MGSERTRKRSMVVERLRDRILFMEFKPGEFVSEARLADEFGLSRTPIRDILHELRAEGWLRASPGLGVYVPALDVVELQNAFEVRVPLEVLAGRLAAERATDDEVEGVREIVRLGRGALAKRDYRELARLDRRFHEVIGNATRNPVLADTVLRLLVPFNRLWYLAMAHHGEVGNVLDEWEACAHAMAARDADRAEQAFRDHMQPFLHVVKPFDSGTRVEASAVAATNRRRRTLPRSEK